MKYISNNNFEILNYKNVYILIKDNENDIYTISETGKVILNELKSSKNIGQLTELLQKNHKIDNAKVQLDIKEFLLEMKNNGCIKVIDK